MSTPSGASGQGTSTVGSGSGSNGANGSGTGGGVADPLGSGSGSGSGADVDAAAPVHYQNDGGVELADADVAQTVTLTMDPFPVPAGQEVYMCQQFANPFGKDVDLVYFDGLMDAGSHHFFVFNMDPSTGRTGASPLGTCPGGGIEFHPFPFLSQKPGHWIVNFPEANMGYPLAASHGLMMQVHYLNSGTAPMTAHVSIVIKAARPGLVTTHVGTFFFNNSTMSVPAGIPQAAPQPFSKTFTPPIAGDYTLVSSWSHMHRWGTKFTASLGNAAPFYTETKWDEPKVFEHTPYMKVPARTPITWSCNYFNDTGKTIGFGESVNDAMCIYFAQYYPADPTNPDIVTVLN